MEQETFGAPMGCVPFNPVTAKREMAGFRYASGHRIEVRDEVTVPAHPEWGTLKVRALNPVGMRVLVSSQGSGAYSVEPCELAYAGDGR